MCTIKGNYKHNNNAFSLWLQHSTVVICKLNSYTFSQRKILIIYFHFVTKLVLTKGPNSWTKGHDFHNYGIRFTWILFTSLLWIVGRFNTFSLYGHICQFHPRGPQPLTQGPSIKYNNFCRGPHGHYNHAFIYFFKYIGKSREDFFFKFWHDFAFLTPLMRLWEWSLISQFIFLLSEKIASN